MAINDPSLTNELRKLRKENTDLKLKNEQLERKEMVYAQKFMRAKTMINNTESNNQNEDREINDLINKYNSKNDELNAKLLVITEKLNTFLNDKNMLQNEKEESLMYKKKYEETLNKFNELQTKYNKMIEINENKKKNHIITIIDRFSIYSVNKNLKNQSIISNDLNYNINQINRSLKNEIMYEIKEVLGNHNIYYPNRSLNSSVNSNFSNLTSSQNQSIDSSNSYNLNFGDKIKAFDKMSIKIENDLKENNIEIDYFDYNIDLTDLLKEENIKSKNEIEINFSKKYNDENIKQFINKKKDILIPISCITNGKSQNSYKGFCKVLNSLISYADNNLNVKTDFFSLNSKNEKIPSFSKDDVNQLNIKLSSLDIPNPLKLITYSGDNQLIFDYLTINYLSICVISLLSKSNINLLNKIIFNENKNHSYPLIIIHNLNNFSKKLDVEYYINHYLLKWINGKESEIKKTYMLTMKDLCEGKVQGQSKNYWYYHQKTKNYDNIIHLIYTKNKTESGEYYNYTTIQFLYSFIKEKGNLILKNNTLTLDKNILNYFKENFSKNKELDKKEYLENIAKTPEYSYMIKYQESVLLVIIDICDLIDDLNINIEIQDKNHYFSITGERILKEIVINQNNQTAFNNRWNGNFSLNFNIPSILLKKVNFSIKYQSIFYRDGSIFIQFGKAK